MLDSFEVVVEVHVGALANLVDEAHLEELVDDLEHEVLRVEVLEGRAYALVDAVEAETALGGLQLARDKVAQLISLIPHLVQVLVRLLFQTV